jgi:hypothetical protein
MSSPLMVGRAAALTLILSAMTGCAGPAPARTGPVICAPPVAPAITPAMPAPMAARPPRIPPALRTSPLNSLCL